MLCLTVRFVVATGAMAKFHFHAFVAAVTAMVAAKTVELWTRAEAHDHG